MDGLSYFEVRFILLIHTATALGPGGEFWLSVPAAADTLYLNRHCQGQP